MGKTKIDFAKQNSQARAFAAVTQRNQNRGEAKIGEKRLLEGNRSLGKEFARTPT